MRRSRDRREVLGRFPPPNSAVSRNCRAARPLAWQAKSFSMKATTMGPDRRRFLMATVSTAAVPSFARTLTAEVATADRGRTGLRDPVNLRLTINGHAHRLALDSRTTL